MNFHDVRLPKFIEVFALGQPEFATSVITTISGREVRNLEREAARQKYLLKNCRLSQSQFEHFNSFFRARRGQNFSFRFRDHADCQVAKQFVAIGDGKSTKFPLIKLYDDPVLPYWRKITKPVKDSVNVYIENQLVEAIIDENNGIIIIPEALATGSILIADFIFDVCVRFSSDSFAYTYAADNSIELAEIELYEVIA